MFSLKKDLQLFGKSLALLVSRSVVPLLIANVLTTPAVAATKNFFVDFVIHQLGEDSLDQIFVPLAADQSVVETQLDLSKLEVKQVGQGLALFGVISVSSELGVAMIGVDEDRNGQIDERDMRLTSEALPTMQALRGQRLVSYAGKSMVHLKLNCPCSGSNRVCSTRSTYKISLVDATTGVALWGPENHDGVMHNECIFDALLGSTQPIPADIAARDPATIKVKMTCGTHTQLVPLHTALSGSQGPKGEVGERGEKGDRGERGEKGEKGDLGERGEKGATGLAGPVGLTGPVGPIGLTGPVGPAGVNGVAGPRGEPGIKGEKGDRGEKGDKGDRGDVGPPGLAGPTGPTGAVGAAGATGPVGAIGPTGLTGPAGLTGPVGPAGPKGDKGEPGSNDIVIAGSDNLISIATPSYVGTVFNSGYVDSRLTALGDNLETKADVVRADGRVVKTKAFSSLTLARTAGRWNDIGTFDDQATILSMHGTVNIAPGEFLLVNSNDDLKIRIVGGKIQEFHTAPTLGGKSVYLEVRAF